MRKSDTEIKISTTNMGGDLPGCGTVWYHESGIVNILSLAKVMKNHTVEFNSESGNNLRSREGRDRGRYQFLFGQQVVSTILMSKNQQKTTNTTHRNRQG